METLWQTIELIIVVFAIVLIILLTVGGNLVVLFAFCNDSHLLTPSNHFLLSMAIADLLVGLIGMPFHSYAQLKTYWPFGELFCKIWITIDDVVTMASVLSIVAITIERYWSINHSVHYRRYTTKTRIRLVSLLIWLIPFLNFAPGIWFLESDQDKERQRYGLNRSNLTHFECIGAYHSHTLYLIIAQINFFAWPLTVIIILNVLIVVNLYKRSHRFPVYASYRVPSVKYSYRKNTLRTDLSQKLEDDEQPQTKQQQRQRQQTQNREKPINNHVQIETTVDQNNCLPSNIVERENCDYGLFGSIKDIDASTTVAEETVRTILPEPPTSSTITRELLVPISSSNVHQRMSLVNCSSKSTQTITTPPLIRDDKRQSIFAWRRTSAFLTGVDFHSKSSSVKTIKTSTGEQRAVRRLRRDKRAATSLFTLVLVFMIFLLPYVVVVVVGRTFSIELFTDTNGQVYSAAFWLLWLNSTVNPILYPFIQPRFREAYRKLFVRFTRRRDGLFALILEIQRSK